MKNSSVLIASSTVSDGSMSASVSADQRLKNRQGFLARYGISAEQTALVHLKYEGNDFRRFVTIDSRYAGDGIVTPSTIVADALFTRDSQIALLLPVADCIGAVLSDTHQGIIGLAHLGRHNLLQEGGYALVRYMVNQFGTDPTQVEVYLSAAAGGTRYPLYDFDNQSMHSVAVDQLRSAGIDQAKITVDDRDTTTDDALFSHSEFLKGNQEIDGRQAVICMKR